MKTLLTLIVLCTLASCASYNVKPVDYSDHATRSMSPDRLTYGTLGNNDVEHDVDADADSDGGEGGDGDSGQ